MARKAAIHFVRPLRRQILSTSSCRRSFFTLHKEQKWVVMEAEADKEKADGGRVNQIGKKLRVKSRGEMRERKGKGEDERAMTDEKRKRESRDVKPD